MRDKLAIYGGRKIINEPLKKYNSYGNEEVEAATLVIKSGVLSKFLGAWHEDFYGGEKVIEFENACKDYFNVKHAITVNSWTSGLVAAIGSIGIEPGDEVIVSPWTMCASATAILQWNAIPVFADIDPYTFCLDPQSVLKNITPYTKAILAVDIHGHSANMDSLMSIAKEYNLKVISDSAQAPGTMYKGKYTGTLGHVGGYSLNYHKHIHTGEGGILVTNDDDIAENLKLIRNHAEAVVEGIGKKNISNMVGNNFRLGEIECAMGIEQLKKLDGLIKNRQNAADKLTEGLKGLKGLRTPTIKEDCTHGYYIYPLVMDIENLGVSRASIIKALQGEGLEGLQSGYANIHMLPMYQNKIAFGSKGFPWNSDICKRDVSYNYGICPVAEKLHDEIYMGFLMCLFDLNDKDIDLIIKVFHKVWHNLDELKYNE